jgi:hypothetical protein
MKSLGAVGRTARGWIGVATAAVVGVAGAAVGAQASSSPNDPHEATAQTEADQILSTFQPPPGASKAAQRPDPLPADLRGPPFQSSAQTQATSIAWYYTAAAPSQVLAWVELHPPAGSSALGAGGDSRGPTYESFQYPTPDGSLTVTPERGFDGRTIIRVDAVVIWTPSRNPDAHLGYGTTSVSVVTTNRLNPQNPLPGAEGSTHTSTDPAIVHKVVDLINALQPPIPSAAEFCGLDDGTRVRITLPGLATVVANPLGCFDVVVTPQGGAPQHYTGGAELVTKVYALFGLTWSRTADLPPGTERTGASAPR